jgi:hypothetical protein
VTAGGRRSIAGRPIHEDHGRFAKHLVAASIALALATPASAQNVPHQSRYRTTVGEGVGQEELPRGKTFEPRVEAAIQYADNINLAEEDQVNAAGIELAPGFYAAYNSDYILGAVDYSLIGRKWDESDYDDVTHDLAANGRWKAVPELFYVDAYASYSDAVIDPSRSLNYGDMGVFGAGNLEERATAGISPTLRKQFQDLLFHATYSYGWVWYLDKDFVPTSSFITVGQEDSEDQNFDLSLGTVQDGRIGGSIFYSWQRSDFDRSLPYQYERAGLDGALPVSRTLSLVGDVGKESDLDETTTEGGLDSNFWSAGLLWEPDQRSSAEARYGERFFGPSYLVEVRTRARMIGFTAFYSETPEVETRQASLQSFEPGTLPPWIDPGTVGGFFTSSPYVAKDARVSLNASGSRTRLTLTGFNHDREYLSDVLGDEDRTGTTFRASRDLASNASLDFDASYFDIERAPSLISGPGILDGTHDYDTQFTVRGNRGIGSQLTASLEAGYFTRSGDQDYDGWFVGLRGRWLPVLR